jgi:hypothetical protein
MNFFGPQDEDAQSARPDDSGNGLQGFEIPIPFEDDFFLAEAEEAPAPAPPRASAPQPPPVPVAVAAPAKRAARERPRRAPGAYLGVYVTQGAVYGALVQDGGDGIQVLRRFARQRSAQGGEAHDFSGFTADTATEDTGDVQIKFGQGNDLGGDLFLDSEFGDLANLGELDDNLSGPKQQATPVVFELKDLLDECTTAGYDKPGTAFCIGQPAVEYVELLVPEDRQREEKKGRDKGKAGKRVRPEPEGAGKGPAVKRDRLLARLTEEYDAPFEKERVSFVPMTPREGAARFLAVVPTPEDALAESLELLREQSGMRAVPFRAIDAEVPLLVGLARWAYPPDPSENTAIVRVGTENTLVILLQGEELHHQEHMLSVTTFDGPDTICSRVLLQQDVQGVGTVHQVVILSEEREEELVRGFAAFYPDARVEALRRGLREHGVIPPNGEAALSARSLLAVGAALRLVLERRKESPFSDVNLLPRRLRRVHPKLDLAIAWHTLVTGVVLFFTVLFFISLYAAQERQITQAQDRLAAYPPEASMSPQALQAQIDSLQTVYVRITATLGTIDSLLVGSDRWSRSVAQLARATASTGGAWVEQWSPQGFQVQLAGMATGREQVVQFAERMSGQINELRFSEIRDYPVYSFVLTAPIPNELPEVARYLREQVDLGEDPQADPLGGTLAAEEPTPSAR